MATAAKFGTTLEAATDAPEVPRFAVRHYTVSEIAALWQLSDDAVRALFEHEPGVIVFGDQRPGKRRYRTIRIPEDVVARVHRKRTCEAVVHCGRRC